MDKKIKTVEQFQNLIEAIVKGTSPELVNSTVTKKKNIRAFLDGNEEASRKCLEFVEDRLICPICVEVVNAPTITKCHHIYCTYCLNKWMMNNENDDSTKKIDSKSNCPTCRSPISPSEPSRVLDDIVEAVMKKHGKGNRPRKVIAVPTVTRKKPTYHYQPFGPPPRHASNLDVIRLMHSLRH